MKRSYEIPVVFRILSSEEETQQAIDQVVAWIENSNEIEEAGKVTKIDRTLLGRRRLAYEIDGQRDGYYVLFYANVDATHLTEFELNMRLYDAVLRYIIVREEEVKVKESKENKENKEPKEDKEDKEAS